MSFKCPSCKEYKLYEDSIMIHCGDCIDETLTWEFYRHDNEFNFNNVKIANIWRGGSLAIFSPTIHPVYGKIRILVGLVPFFNTST